MRESLVVANIVTNIWRHEPEFISRKLQNKLATNKSWFKVTLILFISGFFWGFFNGGGGGNFSFKALAYLPNRCDRYRVQTAGWAERSVWGGQNHSHRDQNSQSI